MTFVNFSPSNGIAVDGTSCAVGADASNLICAAFAVAGGSAFFFEVFFIPSVVSVRGGTHCLSLI